MGSQYRDDDLRYEKVVIMMTDADVDGAHIASLLITFFYRQTPRLIERGHLYLAVPPLFRLTQGAKTVYARDESTARSFFGPSSRLGEGRCGPLQGSRRDAARAVKETTMDPRKRTLLRVGVADGDAEPTGDSIERLMGNKPEARFASSKSARPSRTRLSSTSEARPRDAESRRPAGHSHFPGREANTRTPQLRLLAPALRSAHRERGRDHRHHQV
jgi:DNA gyrase/topoisomerase IV subunit B